MAPRRFEVASTAYRWAARQRPEAADRLVLACEVCPETKPSRRPPRWATIARRLAELAAERSRGPGFRPFEKGGDA